MTHPDDPWAGADATRTRVAVIGDIGGHADALRAELVRLGADPDTGRLPDDLVIVQVGDLVHRGPESDRVVADVDQLIREQPARWLQLVGNHEALYLRRPAFDWPQRLGDQAVATLRRWWDTGRMRAAVALRTEAEPYLVTHAGVTVGYWQDDLGAPATAAEAADRLNELAGRGDERLFRAGEMLGGGRPHPAAGPLWAAASTELVPGWLRVRAPFSQLHGHTSLFDWDRGAFRADAAVAGRTTLDAAARHETTGLEGGCVVVGVDPGHGVRPGGPWRAWEPVRST